MTNVAVSPITVNVKKGATRQFTATVTGTNSPMQSVTWAIEGSHDSGTSISQSGLLTVAANETQKNLTVKATSTADTTKSGTATVTVTDQPVTKYTLTVNGGSGSGDYEGGAAVAITANPPDPNMEFVQWTTTGGGSFANAASAATTFTMPASAVTVTATYRNTSVDTTGNGGSSDDDDDSSSSSGGIYTPPTVVTPPANQPTAPTTAETNVTAKVDSEGEATVTIPGNAVNSAIQAAQDAAKKNSTTENGIAVQINISTNSPSGKTADTVTVNLPKVTQERLITAQVSHFIVVIDTPDIAISLNLDSIKEIYAQANADVQITAAQMINTSSLSDAARAAIGDRPVFQLTASYRGGRVTDFGEGNIGVEIPYTLQPGELAGNLYAVYVDDNGKITYLMNSSYDSQRGVLMFATNHFSIYGVGYKTPDVTFDDIWNHWAKEDIEFVASRGLLNGTGAGQFSPNASMTRGMFVTALGRLAGVNPDSYKTGKFTDVKADTYYAAYVNWAADKGIVSGTTDTTFAPDANISREQMAVMMANYAKTMGYTVPKTREAVTFADNGSIGGWAKDAVRAMQMAGVVNGKDGNRFDPTGTATRGEVAAVLHRYVELVIDWQTAQGLDINDSGSAMMWESGRLVKSQSRTVNGSTYAFNGYGEAALPFDDRGISPMWSKGTSISG